MVRTTPYYHVKLTIILAGGEDYSKNYSARLIHEYRIPLKLAKHLSHNYGSRASLILELYHQSDYNKLPITLAANKSFEPSEDKESEENILSYQSFDEPFTIAESKILFEVRIRQNSS